MSASARRFRSSRARRDLAEVLAELTEAPDFVTASAILLERAVATQRAACAALYVLDGEARRLEIREVLGLASGDVRPQFVTVEEPRHPLATALRAESVVFVPADTDASVPWRPCVCVPLPRRRGARGEAFGVLVVEGEPEPEQRNVLAMLGAYAGPALERARILHALRGSAERLDRQHNLLRAIIDALPDPVIITDASNRVVLQNARAELLLAARPNDSAGRRRAVEVNDVLFTSFLSRVVLAGPRGSAAERSAEPRELNLVDPQEGSDLLFEVLSHTLPETIAGFGDGEGAHIAVLRDVTDLKRASIELEYQYNRARVSEIEATRERDRLNVILRHAGEPILVTDDQGKILLMNPQAEQLFEAADSAPPERARRARWNGARFNTLIAGFVLSADVSRREPVALAHPATGRELPLEVVAAKVPNERGEPMAIVCVLHDLTRQVENERLNQMLTRLNAELEDRIRVATADLESQNLQLQWQSRELEKASRLKGEFLANMSHEIRTPINALLGFTSLLLEGIYGPVTARQMDGLRRIQTASQHLLALINDILDLAKIESGKMPIRVEPTVLRPLLVEVAAQIEPLARRKSLALELDIDEAIPPIETDPLRVRQIVLNLVSNAVKFTHHGRVTLRATMKRAGLVLEVADTGIGMRPQDLDAIFEEFRQVDQSRTRAYGGTGLGLSITRKLVRLLGGEISVKSEDGVGSTFTVVIPLRVASRELSAVESAAELTGAGGEVDLS